MPNKIFLDIDETVGPDAIAEMQRSMMEASLMYPGVQFELQRRDGRNSDNLRVNTHVNLYPEVGSSGLYGLGEDQESHIVMSRDPMTYGGGLSYRSASGDVRVVKTDLSTLDGLTPDQKVREFTKAITNEAGRMYGRNETFLRDDLSEAELEEAWNEIQAIFVDEAGDPEEEMEQLEKVFSRIRKEPKTGKRQPKTYSVAGEKTVSVQKPAKKKTPQQVQQKKKAQSKVAQPKQPQPPQKKGGGRRKLGPMKIGKISSLK